MFKNLRWWLAAILKTVKSTNCTTDTECAANRHS